MRRAKIVVVEWEDASTNTGYWDKNDPERFGPVPTETVGHLIKKDKSAVYLCAEVFRENGKKITDRRHIHTIPRKMIKRIRELEG